MSDTESDCSLDTEELNEIKGSIKDTFEEVEVKGVEREKTKKKIKKVVKTEEEEQQEYEEKQELKDYNKSFNLDEEGKPLKKEKPKKKREMTEKQKEALKKGREKALENRKKKQYKYDDPPVEELKERDEKPKRGRPKTKEIIKTEKIIYMIPNSETGEYEKVTNPPKLTARDMKKIEREKKAQEQEKELGKKLTRKKNGEVDKRSTRTLTNGRTEKQIEATRKMLEANKKRREQQLKTKEQKQTEIMKKEISNTIVDVVSQPAEIVRAKRERTEEQIKKDKLRKAVNLFS
tara:strand:+ start:3896 stop:4768 length:873 start_codon:yes stop_codon:yes gene_type:complete